MRASRLPTETSTQTIGGQRVMPDRPDAQSRQPRPAAAVSPRAADVEDRAPVLYRRLLVVAIASRRGRGGGVTRSTRKR
jgi:hypothetical protein